MAKNVFCSDTCSYLSPRISQTRSPLHWELVYSTLPKPTVIVNATYLHLLSFVRGW